MKIIIPIICKDAIKPIKPEIIGVLLKNLCLKRITLNEFEDIF